jgi:hypothetical protein
MKDLEKIFNPPRRFKKFSEMLGNNHHDKEHQVDTKA